MRMNHFLDVIYTHTEGAPTCIIHGGITWPPGSSILEKLRYAEANLDWLRRAIMLEPRGHKDMYGVFLVPPSQPGFDAGDAVRHPAERGGLALELLAGGILVAEGSVIGGDHVEDAVGDALPDRFLVGGLAGRR